MFQVAIVGRPNVGKSTLFNRLARKKLAIINDIPGVTRDRNDVIIEFGNIKFNLIDTPGLEKVKLEDNLTKSQKIDKEIINLAYKQTLIAIEHAHLILFIVDYKYGILESDYYYANFVRKYSKAMVLIANKCDVKQKSGFLETIYQLGIDNIILSSAEHNIGIAKIYQTILHNYQTYIKNNKTSNKDYLLNNHKMLDINNPNKNNINNKRLNSDYIINFDDPDSAKDENYNIEKKIISNKEDINKTGTVKAGTVKAGTIKIAIVGRPNVGKSTLINSLLKEDRVITGDMPGLTRDSVSICWKFENQNIELIDTAGLKRKAKTVKVLDKLSLESSFKSIQYAQIVVLVIDATQPFEKQDLLLLDYVLKEGRGLMLALNKWDLIQKDKQESFLNDVYAMLDGYIKGVRSLPLIPISALHQENLQDLMPDITIIYKLWNSKVATVKLNNWLQKAQDYHAPPMYKGNPVKLKYATQLKIRPPTFAIYSNYADKIPESYERYLLHSLREEFDLIGILIRLYFRKSNNPYSTVNKRPRTKTVSMKKLERKLKKKNTRKLIRK